MPVQTSNTVKAVHLAGEAPCVFLMIDNPPLNIIDIPLMDNLAAALSEIQSRPDVSIIVIRATGTHFSAGVDVAAHAPDQVATMLEKFHGVIRAILATRKITIAAVHGHCLGGGAELAMVCDMVYTTDDAQWAFPELQLGCFPPVAVTALAALVGQKRAADLILTARTITGTEAARIGLANEAVSSGELAGTLEQAVDRLSKLSPASLAIAKKASYAWDAMHFDKGLARAEKIYLDELMKTADAQEGLRAFLEKRNPKWKGR
jgi:cyclohexa-1,5-dienecarbonyl-CoA hydratase